MPKIVAELADALYDSFAKDEDVDTYNDSQIGRILKKQVGKKDFEEYDELTHKEWKEAWGMFNAMLSGTLKR